MHYCIRGVQTNISEHCMIDSTIKGRFSSLSLSFSCIAPQQTWTLHDVAFFLSTWKSVSVWCPWKKLKVRSFCWFHLASMHLKLHCSIARFGFSKSKLQKSANHRLLENPALLQIQMSPNIKNPTSTTTICSGNHSPKRALVTSPLKKRLGFASMILTAISTTKNTSMHGDKSQGREVLMSLEAQHPNSTI